jgi:hypothetical protein
LRSKVRAGDFEIEFEFDFVAVDMLTTGRNAYGLTVAVWKSDAAV